MACKYIQQNIIQPLKKKKVILDIILSETRQSQENRNHVFQLYEVSQVFKFKEKNKIGHCSVLGGGGNGAMVFNKYRCSALLMKSTRHLVYSNENIYTITELYTGYWL